MRALLLKAGATVVTLVATAAAAVYVNGHVRSASAPLHPAVLGGPALAGDAGVVPTGARPVTSTYVS